MEEWKVFKDCDRFEVSNMGRIRERDTGEIVSVHKECDGYNYIYPVVGDTVKTYRVDEMVATTFISQRPSTHVVKHIDRNTTNNAVNNLKWTNPMNIRVLKSVPYSSRILCEQNGEIYDNFYVCSEELGISLSLISKSIVCRSRSDVHFKYTFEILDPL